MKSKRSSALLAALTALLILASVMSGCDFGDVSETGKPIIDGTEETPVSKPAEKPEIEEQICFEHDGVKVTAKSITEGSILGSGIKFLVENNSGTDYTVGTEAVIVNNRMVSDLFSCEVAAGKKANETLYLSDSDLEAAGIDAVGQVEIYFTVYESSSFKTVYKPECVTLKTSLYDKADLTLGAPAGQGRELFNGNGVKIVGKYVKDGSLLGSSVVLYIENSSDKNVLVSCDDISVNGFMVTAMMSSTVYGGKSAVDDVLILSSSLEENDITNVEKVELKFRISDAQTYETIVETDAISFDVKS